MTIYHGHVVLACIVTSVIVIVLLVGLSTSVGTNMTLHDYDTVVSALTPNMQLLPYGKAAPKPFTNAFNGSIVHGTYVVRLDKPTPKFFHDRKLAAMDWQDGTLSTPQLLHFKTENDHAEDPRCFDFNGRPALMFNDGNTMYFGYIDTEECWKMDPPANKPTGHDGREKNWSPFVYKGQLHVLYAPGHVVQYDYNKPTGEYLTKAPTLTMGQIRGGTQLVEYDSKLYTIFHVQQRINGTKLYWAGLMELEAEPPFRALRWSRKPLWKATFDEPTPAPHTIRKPTRVFVTFPSHLEIDAEGNCMILTGYHDYTDAIIRLPLKELLKYIV